MHRRPTTPRKRPRQARSKATVDSILDATTRVLVKHGRWLTTNAAAQAAGCPIGSLYQYFPIGGAYPALIVLHGRDEHGDPGRADAGREIANGAGRACGHRVDDPRTRDRSELHRVLTEQVPRTASSLACGRWMKSAIVWSRVCSPRAAKRSRFAIRILPPSS
jgi:hypothetical protein